MNKWTALAVCAVATAGLVLVACGGSSRTTYTVPSAVMEPTVHCALPGVSCEAAVGDEVVTESLRSDPQRGDILVFHTPPPAELQCGAGGTFIMRVVALPGETWEEREGVVFINGKRLGESYVEDSRRDQDAYPRRKIPEGRYFVMGDNRAQSCDSREWGAVPRGNIIGTVVRIRRPG